MSHHPRYFFYNVHGGADDLLKSIPEDVIPVCFTKDEERRNEILEQLGVSVSHLPCVVYWRDHEEAVVEADGSQRIVPPHWATFVFDEFHMPWKWAAAPY